LCGRAAAELGQGSFTTQVAWNDDRVRTSKTVSGDTTQYVLDLAATLPVVVSDTEAVYLYGLDIIAQQQADRQYYFSDGLGSVRQLLDSAGDLEANYAYDPFGVPVVAGDASNPYQFTGEAWDEEVELLYLRARYYQPETGRFITKDPWPGKASRPRTLNHYAYFANNPTGYVDPKGLEGGEPGGICPECKELLHPADFDWFVDWFSDDEEDNCEEYHEWIRHWRWPDPWGQEALVSAEVEWIPPVRVGLISEAKKMYEDRGFPNIEVYAWSKQDNPLDANLMSAGCVGGLTVRTIANSLQPPFNILIDAFGMNWLRRTNYEPYFLSLLMDSNAIEMKSVRFRVYKWWCAWYELFDTEPEEFFHPVVAE
jgi:RHS repeat-associated protein